LKQRLDRFLRAGAEGILAVLVFACVANYLTAEGIQDNQLALVEGFLLGIVASGIAWRVAEYMVQPSLEIVVDTNRARVGESHEFYHVRVRNTLHEWPWPGRRPAWACSATIDVFQENRTRAIIEAVPGRWASQPEPLLPVGIGNREAEHAPESQVGLWFDIARVIQGRRIDVHSHRYEALSIALKYEGEPECYLFSNESYDPHYPQLRNPAWCLDRGRYRVRVSVYYESGRTVRGFELRNDGPSRDDVRLLPWPSS
jgi:hypothetical protein